eukprot:5302333-Amphidinium_carterae.1
MHALNNQGAVKHPLVGEFWQKEGATRQTPKKVGTVSAMTKVITLPHCLSWHKSLNPRKQHWRKADFFSRGLLMSK